MCVCVRVYAKAKNSNKPRRTKQIPCCGRYIITRIYMQCYPHLIDKIQVDVLSLFSFCARSTIDNPTSLQCGTR